MGKTVVSPNLKLFRLLWLLLGLSIILSVIFVFNILQGKVLVNSVLLVFTSISFRVLYLKSIANYNQVFIEDKIIFIYKFKQLYHRDLISNFSFTLEELERPKNFKKLTITWEKSSISISSLEHSNLEEAISCIRKVKKIY